MGRILIADDHDALRRGLGRALTDAGHEVEEAPNGNAAIERLHDSYYDVVLSDLKMGGSDGLDVLRTAVAVEPDAPNPHNNLGIALAQAGQLDAAIVEFREALRLDPRHDNARRNLDAVARLRQR